MKKLILLLFAGAVALGLFDGGDMTAAVVLGVLFLPLLFEKGGKGCEKKQRRSNL